MEDTTHHHFGGGVAGPADGFLAGQIITEDALPNRPDRGGGPGGGAAELPGRGFGAISGSAGRERKQDEEERKEKKERKTYAAIVPMRAR